MKQNSSARSLKKEKTSSTGKLWLVRIGLAILALITYGPSVRYGFTLDDETFFTQNILVQQGVSAVGKIFTSSSLPGSSELTTNHPYRPVTTLSFAVDKSLFGNNASASHFVNIILYIFLLQVLLTLLMRLAPEYHLWVPAAIVTLYAVHPIHTEVVASIKSRDELLAALFGVLAWIKFKEANTETENQRSSSILAALFFLLALFSKESAITFLAILPMSMFFFNRQPWKKIARNSWPLLVSAGIFLLCRQLVVGNEPSGSVMPILDNILNSASGLGEATATRCMLLFQYLKLLFVPWPSCFDYSFSQFVITHWNDPAAWAGLVAYIAIPMAALMLLKRHNWLSFSALFYMVTLSPVSNLLFINSSTLSERFLFVPSLAFCIAIVHLSARWLKTDLSSGTVLKRTPLLIGFLAIVGIGAVVTRTEAAFWKDNITLFEHGVQAAPNSVRTHYNLATEYWKLALKSNDPAKAKELSDASIRHFNRSLELLPENFMCMTNLGCLYDLRDDFDSSYHFFKKSLQLNANQPVVYTNLSKIHLKKGSALERSGDIAGAIAYYRKSFSFDSTDIAPLNAIALTYGNRQRYDSATVWLQAALRLQPNDRTTIENAAVIAFFEKRYDASIALAGKSISLFGNSKRMLGVMADSYHALGNDSAVARYVQLIRQFPQ